MTKPLSILHTESSTGWGGQEIRILTEARGMLDRGHRVMLMSPANAEILPAAKGLGIPVTPLNIERKRLLPLLAMRNWLHAHGNEYDVINTHSSTDSWLAAIACASLLTRPGIVRTRHVSTPVNNKFSTRWLYTKATAHIVTTGEALRLQLYRDNGYALDHMTSVRTGIDLARFRPMDRASARAQLGLDDLPTVGILATLRDWKGHRHLLEAMAQLRERFPDWRLLIVGDGPERARLEAATVEMGLQSIVRFAGNQRDVTTWLSACDVFALPSYGSEGVPQGIMQAMACGLPVVATPVGAVAEAVHDGVTGLMTSPCNPTALAATLAKLLADSDLRKRMGEAGRIFAHENFGIDIMVDRMQVIFVRIASHARS